MPQKLNGQNREFLYIVLENNYRLARSADYTVRP